jgi:hypothetical protein
VYNYWGNTPKNAPDAVITYQDKHFIILKGWVDDKTRQETYRKLWKPLPLEHPRVQAWIADVYKYFGGCYVDPRTENSTHVSSFMFSMLAGRALYEVATDVFGLTVSSELRDYLYPAKYDMPSDHPLYAELTQLRKEVKERTYRPTTYIQEFYPDFKHTENPPAPTGHWYTLMAERPTPEECPGELGWGNTPTSRHPVNSSWCQVCGWKE